MPRKFVIVHHQFATAELIKDALRLGFTEAEFVVYSSEFDFQNGFPETVRAASAVIVGVWLPWCTLEKDSELPPPPADYSETGEHRGAAWRCHRLMRSLAITKRMPFVVFEEMDVSARPIRMDKYSACTKGNYDFILPAVRRLLLI